MGFDALTAIKEYFDCKRGWPTKPGDPLLVSQRNTPLSKYAFYQSHYRRVERLGYFKQNDGSTRAHGFGPHNFRDLAKTLLHLKGKRDGIDMAWVDFALGHTVDKLGYDPIRNEIVEIFGNFYDLPNLIYDITIFWS